MAFRPETAKPLNELVDILLRGPHSLTPGERELIATYVSSENDCRFCQTMHGAIAAHHLGGDEALVGRSSATPERAAISRKLKALLMIAGKTAESGKLVTAEDIARARQQGATDLEIHDTVLIAAFFCLCNRYVDGLATDMPDSPRLLPRARAAGRPVRLHDVDLGAGHAGRPLTDAAMADERSGGPGAATLDERSIRYEGWRVVAASALGVFVGFGSLLVYTFGIFLKPLAEQFSLVARSRLGGLRLRRHLNRHLLATARAALRSPDAAASNPAVPGRVRLRVRVARSADSAPLASVRGLCRPRLCRQRHRADGLLARRLELVPCNGAAWRSRSSCRVARSARSCCRRSRNG